MLSRKKESDSEIGFKDVPLRDLHTVEIEQVVVDEELGEVDLRQLGGKPGDDVEEANGEEVKRNDIVMMCYDKLLVQIKGVLPVCIFLAGFQVRMPTESHYPHLHRAAYQGQDLPRL